MGRNYDTDAVIVGAGPGGLSAAYEFCARGGSAVLLEKSTRIGGVSGGGIGMFAVESYLQKQQLLSFTREDALKWITEYTHGCADERLAGEYIRRSASTVEWFRDMGAIFSRAVAYYEGAEYTWHMYSFENELRLPERIVHAMDEKGFSYELRTGCTAKEILMENGRACGIRYEDENGTHSLRAKVVILSTGGFGGNSEWVRRFSGLTQGEDLFTMDIHQAQGEGLQMAWAAGAMKGRMDVDIYCGLGGTFGGPGGVNEYLQSFRQPNLMVNFSGERFMNEENMKIGSYAANGVRAQEKHSGFMILDSETERYYEQHGWDYIMNDLPSVPDSTDARVKKAMTEQPGWLFAADSLEEMADMTGICKETLRQTAAEYNAACDCGRDDLLYKSAKYLRPVRTAPFYAARFVLNGYGTLGGIKINHKTEVIGESWRVIPGLYAAGNDTNSLFGDSYPFMLSGNTSGYAYNTGRMAGEHSASYAARLVE